MCHDQALQRMISRQLLCNPPRKFSPWTIKATIEIVRLCRPNSLRLSSQQVNSSILYHAMRQRPRHLRKHHLQLLNTWWKVVGSAKVIPKLQYRPLNSYSHTLAQLRKPKLTPTITQVLSRRTSHRFGPQKLQNCLRWLSSRCEN